LLLLGDLDSLGLHFHEGVFYETSLKVRRAQPIAYVVSLSDQETAFLGDSLAAISMANEALLKGISHMCLLY
jgi:hypothetical protein